MNKRYWIFLGLVSFFIYLVWQKQDVSKSTESINPKGPVVSYESKPPREAEETPPRIDSVRPNRLIAESEVRGLRRSFPHTEDVKLEVKENPHQTPDSLIKFAKTLGPLVEKAMKNSEDANILTKALEDCVSNDNVIVSARTLCLSKAEELASAYPKLKNKFLDIQKNAGPDVLELERRKKSFNKKQ